MPVSSEQLVQAQLYDTGYVPVPLFALESAGTRSAQVPGLMGQVLRIRVFGPTPRNEENVAVYMAPLECY